MSCSGFAAARRLFPAVPGLRRGQAALAPPRLGLLRDLPSPGHAARSADLRDARQRSRHPAAAAAEKPPPLIPSFSLQPLAFSLSHHGPARARPLPETRDQNFAP